MHNDRIKGEAADLLDKVNLHIRSIAEVQRKRVELVATATAREKRVTVTCNADGVPIDIDFSDDIDDLDYDDIAMAVLEAAQDAAEKVADQAEELLAPIRQTRSRLPNLSSMVQGLPDIRTKIPEAQRASFASPTERELLRSGDPHTEPGSAAERD